MNAAPSSYSSLTGEQKQLASSPSIMTLKEAHRRNLRASTFSSSVPSSPPKSPNIPIQSRGMLSHRQILDKAAAAIDFQDLQFYNRVVTGIKTATEKQYESKELLEQNEICLENIMRTRSDGLNEDYVFEPESDEHALGTDGWESDDEEQFVLDL